MEENDHHHSPATLPGKESRYPLNKRFGGPRSLSGRFEEQKILFNTHGIKTLNLKMIGVDIGATDLRRRVTQRTGPDTSAVNWPASHL